MLGSWFAKKQIDGTLPWARLSELRISDIGEVIPQNIISVAPTVGCVDTTLNHQVFRSKVYEKARSFLESAPSWHRILIALEDGHITFVRVLAVYSLQGHNLFCTSLHSPKKKNPSCLSNYSSQGTNLFCTTHYHSKGHHLMHELYRVIGN